jgi:4,5-DOPA dioxygenase extradiol
LATDNSDLPVLFISHGAPDLILRDTPARRFLQGLSGLFPRPKAVLSISAHWETEAPMVDMSRNPETIHNFFGFADELYTFKYEAAGAPDLAAKTKALIEATGLGPVGEEVRGLDHGAWVPMILPYPEADIPICQLSIQDHCDPGKHFALGQTLAGLRADGVLVMATGNINHNLNELRIRNFDLDAETPDWVIEFRDWMSDAIAANRIDDLLNYRTLAPHAERNHPRDDHLMPLFVALGAGTGPDGLHAGRLIHQSYDYGVLAMDSFAFD